MKKTSSSRLDQACLEYLEAHVNPLVALEYKFEEVELASQDPEAVASLSQEFEKGKVLVEKGWSGEDPAHVVTRQLFLAAYEDPANLSTFERHVGKAVDSQMYKTIEVTEYLALLGSPYVFEYESDLECAIADQSFWSERFREQRKTPEFFELMERAGKVEYWREFGWPDDCASLDQTLAECGP